MQTFCHILVLVLGLLQTVRSDTSIDLEDHEIGCYADGEGANHVLPVGSSQNYTSIQPCISHCSSMRLIYVGLKNGRECWCGDVYPNRVGKSDCNIPCPNDPSRQCGGQSALSVYTICPKGKFDENCASNCNCNLTVWCHYNGTCSFPLSDVTIKPLPTTKPIVAVNCSIDDGGCEHSCSRTQQGDQCLCYEGYILQNITQCVKDSRETYYFYAAVLGNFVLFVILFVVIAACAIRGRRIRRLKVIVYGRKNSAETSTLKKKPDLDDAIPTHTVLVTKAKSAGYELQKNGSPMMTRSLGRPNGKDKVIQTPQLAPNFAGRQIMTSDGNPNITRKMTNVGPPPCGWDSSPESYAYVAMQSGNFRKPAGQSFDHAVASPDFIQYQATYDDATSGRQGMALPSIPVSESDFPTTGNNARSLPRSPQATVNDNNYYLDLQRENSYLPMMEYGREVSNDDYNDALSHPAATDEFYLQVIDSPN